MSEEQGARAPSSSSEPAGDGVTGVTGWVLGALVLIAGVVLATLSNEVPERVARGVAAPPFELPLLGPLEPVDLQQANQPEEGARVALSSLRGQVVLVNFWATWCKPCEDEMPSMQRLYASLDGEPFEMLAVSVDEDVAEVERFRARMALTFPILLDPAQTVSRQYQTTGFPESLLIDGSGQVVERYVGPRTWDDPAYVERIRALVAADS